MRHRPSTQDKGFEATYARRSEYWILDAAEYYFANMDRFGDDEFDPTEEDMIMTRVRTTGIVCSELAEPGNPPLKFTVVDVGGQRSERRKWIHCFDDVKAVMFLEGMSGYHQVCAMKTCECSSPSLCQPAVPPTTRYCLRTRLRIA